MRLSRPLAANVLLCASLLVLGMLAGCASAPQATNPTPVPTPVIEGPLASVIRAAVESEAQRAVTSYDASAQVAKITLTVGAAPNVATAQARVKALCFQVEKALWTSNPSLHEVKVIVLGPIRDDYANIIDDAYGVSDVFAPTAIKLAWTTLSPEAAWEKYDSTWLRPTYSPNWLYGKNN